MSTTTSDTTDTAVELSDALGLSKAEAAELVVSLVRQSAAHGYPNGITREELSIRFDVVDGQVADAQLALAGIGLLMDGAVDIWVQDDGEVIYLRRNEATK
jgi:DNA-binding IclR family transcriptional regulator